MGGAVAAVESGYMKQRSVASHAPRRQRIESGEDVVVGVNRFTTTEPNPLTADLDAAIQTVDPAVEAQRGRRGAGLAGAAGRDAGGPGAAEQRAAPGSRADAEDRREPDGRRRWSARGPG